MTWVTVPPAQEDTEEKAKAEMYRKSLAPLRSTMTQKYGVFFGLLIGAVLIGSAWAGQYFTAKHAAATEAKTGRPLTEKESAEIYKKFMGLRSASDKINNSEEWKAYGEKLKFQNATAEGKALADEQKKAGDLQADEQKKLADLQAKLDATPAAKDAKAARESFNHSEVLKFSVKDTAGNVPAGTKCDDLSDPKDGFCTIPGMKPYTDLTQKYQQRAQELCGPNAYLNLVAATVYLGAIEPKCVPNAAR